MATVRFIVNSALRKIGRLAAGREPRVADQADVLTALQTLYSSWIDAGAFGRLADVVPTVSYTAGENERIVRTSPVIVVTLPDMISDRSGFGHYDEERATVDGGSRPPRDGSVVQIHDEVGGQTDSYLYDSTLRSWTLIDSLQLDNQAPRSVDPEGLSAMLAMEIADTFGADVGPTTLRQASRFQAALAQRFGSPRQPVPGVYC